MAIREYEVIQTCRKTGKCLGAVAGMGKNAGTWDSTHSKTQAYYWKNILENTGMCAMYSFKVVECGK